MFRMIGFGENLGSGFPLILSAWNEKHWLEPELIEQKDLKQVKLVLHIRPAIVVKDCGNSGGNKLTERQEIVLRLIIENRHITANEIVKIMSVNGDVAKRTIERELAMLKKRYN
jgi:predicted HTH transcriptional regulator